MCVNKNTCSNVNKKDPLTKVVFWTNFEQIYCTARSISLKSLNYREYSINQKLAQIRTNNVKATSFVLTSIMHLLGGLLLRFEKRKPFFQNIILLVWFSVHLTRFKSCDPFKPLCWVTSVPQQNFSFFRKRSSISSFDRDSVFVKTSRITNREYLKGTIGSLHFSMKCFTILLQWTDCLMWLSATQETQTNHQPFAAHKTLKQTINWMCIRGNRNLFV